MEPISIRAATLDDLRFLWNMLLESAFTTDEQRAAWRNDPLRPPGLAKYLHGWIRPGDAGVIAEDDAGTPVGAAWYRLFARHDRGDGIMAEPNIPELAIAVEPEQRGRRIGECSWQRSPRAHAPTASSACCSPSIPRTRAPAGSTIASGSPSSTRATPPAGRR